MTHELTATTQRLLNAGDYSLIKRDATDATVCHMWLHSGRRASSPRTQQQYLRTWRAFSAYVAKPLQAVTLEDLQAWQASLTGAPATRKATTAAVRSLFAFAQSVGYVRANVATMLEQESVPDLAYRKVVDEPTILRMVDRCETPRDTALLLVLYSSGARVSEILALTWQDVTPRTDGGAVLHILFGKGRKQREAGISRTAHSAMLALRDEAAPATAPVFSTRTGKALDRQAAHRIIKQVAQRAGVADFSCHWLRHSHASHAAQRGGSLPDIMTQLGHSNSATTAKYFHAANYSSDRLVL